MTTIKTSSGESIECDQLPLALDELLSTIIAADVVLDPLTGEDAEIDPAKFVPEAQKYVKDLFTLKTKPNTEFVNSGMIGETLYWIFQSTPKLGMDLYIFVVRNAPVTEIVCGERSATYYDKASGMNRDCLLSPAQAALLEYCTTDLSELT